jgi:hypothetical protein
MQGRIQDFKLEGAHLKKLRRLEGAAKMFGAKYPKYVRASLRNWKKYDFLA